jgi:hypothetical protein
VHQAAAYSVAESSWLGELRFAVSRTGFDVG